MLLPHPLPARAGVLRAARARTYTARRYARRRSRKRSQRPPRCLLLPGRGGPAHRRGAHDHALQGRRVEQHAAPSLRAPLSARSSLRLPLVSTHRAYGPRLSARFGPYGSSLSAFQLALQLGTYRAAFGVRGRRTASPKLTSPRSGRADKRGVSRSVLTSRPSGRRADKPAKQACWHAEAKPERANI